MCAMICACAVFTLAVPVGISCPPSTLALLYVLLSCPFSGIPKYGVLHLKYNHLVCISNLFNIMTSIVYKVIGIGVWYNARYGQI